MPENSDTKPIPSNCEDEAVRLITKREYTIAVKLRKIVSIVLCCLALLFAYWLGGLRSIQRHDEIRLQTKQIGAGTIVEIEPSNPSTGEKLLGDELPDESFAQRCRIYLYDTDQKVKDLFKRMVRVYYETEGILPTREWIAEMTSERPILTVGPFVVVLEVNDNWSVRELSYAQALVSLGYYEQSKRLKLFSLPEKGWKSQRFGVDIFYSDDGIYECGYFAVFNEDRIRVRTYFDDEGIGVFNRMEVLENGIYNTYHLNGCSWEKVDENQYHPVMDDLRLDINASSEDKKP